MDAIFCSISQLHRLAPGPFPYLTVDSLISSSIFLTIFFFMFYACAVRTHHVQIALNMILSPYNLDLMVFSSSALHTPGTNHHDEMISSLIGTDLCCAAKPRSAAVGRLSPTAT